MPIETLVPYIEKFESQRKELVTQIQMYESKLSELKELYLKLSGAVEALNLIEADLNKEDEPEESENF